MSLRTLRVVGFVHNERPLEPVIGARALARARDAAEHRFCRSDWIVAARVNGNILKMSVTTARAALCVCYYAHKMSLLKCDSDDRAAYDLVAFISARSKKKLRADRGERAFQFDALSLF